MWGIEKMPDNESTCSSKPFPSMQLLAILVAQHGGRMFITKEAVMNSAEGTLVAEETSDGIALRLEATDADV